MILIATASPDLLARCKLGLVEFFEVLSVANSDALRTSVAGCPRVLLVDLDSPGLKCIRGIARSISTHPAVRTMAVCPAQSAQAELTLYEAGVFGCRRIDMEPQQLLRTIRVADQGEVWIKRAFLPRLLNEMFGELIKVINPAAWPWRVWKRAALSKCLMPQHPYGRVQ
jgi:hypothetical protein